MRLARAPGSVGTTMGECVRLGAALNPDRVAVDAFDGRPRTYAVLNARTNRLANALLGSGLVRGDRVGAWLETTAEYVELYIAAAKAGLVVVPANERFTAREAEYQLRHSGADVIFVSQALAERVDSLDPTAFRTIVCVGEGDLRGAVAFERLIEDGADVAPPPPDEDDLFIIGYTSGTTGFPKGAMLTHRAVKNAARVMAHAARYPLGGIHAFAGSMSFVATVPAQILPHLHVGGTVLLLGRWEPELLIDVIESRAATFAYLPTPGLEDFAAEVARRPEGCRSLVSALHGGSKAAPEAVRLVVESIGDRFIEGWGMTENSGSVLTATTPADFERAKECAGAFEGVGRAVTDVIVEVVDEEGAPLPHDGTTVGELVALSSSMMSGYWKDREATDAAFKDGWYHTGDLGAVHPDGTVVIADRRLDLILSGGANVYPGEIERVVGAMNEVSEVAVVGAPHAHWGQTPVAFIVRSYGSTLTAQAVIAQCRASLASYKKPSQVIFVDELPRNASNKVLKSVLRDVAAKAREPTSEFPT